MKMQGEETEKEKRRCQAGDKKAQSVSLIGKQELRTKATAGNQAYAIETPSARQQKEDAN
jgi:hypothetical protein